MSRSTIKTDFIKIDDIRNTTCLTSQDLVNAYNKLIKLEDLLEKYNIKDIKELEKILKIFFLGFRG